MKKTLSVLLSVLICGTIFVGCNKERELEEAIKDVEASTEESVSLNTNPSDKVTQSTVDITEAQTDDRPVASGKDFIAAYYKLSDGIQKPFKETTTCNFCKETNNTDSIYYTYTNSTEYYSLAIDGKNVYVDTNEDGEPYTRYIVDNVMTKYFHDSKTAVKCTMTDEYYDYCGFNKSLDTYKKDVDFDSIDEVFTIYNNVDVNGNKYIYEVNSDETVCNIYDQSEMFVTGLHPDGMSDDITVYTNFTTKVPPEVWTQPTGYEIKDIGELNEQNIPE